jgi:hypothetical protein
LRRNWHWRVVALSAAAVLALGACGGDDDDDDASGSGSGSEPTEEASGDDGAFCTDIVAADQAVTAASEGGDPAAAEAALTTAQESAPDDLADPVDTMVTEANSLLSGPPPAEDGPPVIPSDDFFTASVEVGDWMADNCEYGDFPVTAQNYEFEGIPEEVPAGETLIRLTNEGTEYHEAAILKIADGEERSLEELLALPEEEIGAVVSDVGFVFAPPSLGSWAVVDLEPGRHVAICFIPVGTTPDVLQSGAPPEEGPAHFMEGMVTEFTVA